jgi:CDP-diacylglycerol--glycerol-3-phosphate 3-phosphatidyltransferase
VQANPSIQVDILVDYFRGSRIDANGKSTVSIISPLYQNYPNQCRLYLYHTPNVTELIKSIVPARFIEGFGLQHMKLYIFDDSLLISGANLSTDYFTNRQDRYILIRNHPSICDYFAGVIRIVSSFSYKNGSKVSAGVTRVSEIRNMLNDHLIRNKNTKIAEDNSSSSLVHESASTSSMTQDVSSTFIYPSLQMATFGIKQEEAIISRLLEYGGKNTQ